MSCRNLIFQEPYSLLLTTPLHLRSHANHFARAERLIQQIKLSSIKLAILLNLNLLQIVVIGRLLGFGPITEYLSSVAVFILHNHAFLRWCNKGRTENEQLKITPLYWGLALALIGFQAGILVVSRSNFALSLFLWILFFLSCIFAYSRFPTPWDRPHISK